MRSRLDISKTSNTRNLNECRGNILEPISFSTFGQKLSVFYLYDRMKRIPLFIYSHMSEPLVVLKRD